MMPIVLVASAVAAILTIIVTEEELSSNPHHCYGFSDAVVTYLDPVWETSVHGSCPMESATSDQAPDKVHTRINAKTQQLDPEVSETVACWAHLRDIELSSQARLKSR